MTGDPRTVPAALDGFAHQLPDHAALVTDDRSFTAAELRNQVHQATAALIALGVQPRDRVAIWSPNTWHWVIACLAIHHAGAAMVPLNTRYTASEAADILARTGAPVLFGMGQFLGNDRIADLDRAALPALRHVVRIPIAADDGTWDEFIATGVDIDAVDARAAAVIPDDVSDYFAEMGRIAVNIGYNAKDVVLSRDPYKAAKLADEDDAVDEIHRHLFTVIMDHQWPHPVATAVDITLLSRYYERFADHAVEIGRRVIFQATGTPII